MVLGNCKNAKTFPFIAKRGYIAESDGVGGGIAQHASEERSHSK
jgi:hypothetical protein